MLYNQPVGGAANDPYVTGNPSTGTPGSTPPGASIEYPQREIVNTITAAGIAPSNGDLYQLAKAIQSDGMCTAVATGLSDAIAAVFSPPITVINTPIVLYVRALAANVTGTPVFTPASGVIAAAGIVKGNNLPLALGDIAGAGHSLCLQWDPTWGKWILQNPATGIAIAQPTSKIQAISASVAASALTVGLNPTTLDFRSPMLGSGAVNTRTLAVALSLIIPSGATLGTGNGVQSRLILVALDNAGVQYLGIVNLAGGVNLDETTLVSTTAISGAATANNIIYSGIALTSVPFRVVGFLDNTQAAAGTWATAPSTIQGIGGQAMAAMGSLGFGQTWQAVTRTAGVTYYNTTGKPLVIKADTNGSATSYTQISINGVAMGYLNVSNTPAGSSFETGQMIIPPGSSYVLTDVGTRSGTWELR